MSIVWRTVFYPEMTVHILRYGRTLCGMDGTPNEWPEDHRWVGEDHADQATCAACMKGLLHLKTDAAFPKKQA